MTLSTRERDDLKKEELIKRARGLRLKLEADGTDIGEVLAALEEEPPEDRDALRKVLWEVMIDLLPLNGEELLRSLTAMEHLPQAASKGGVLREMRACFKNALKRQAEDRKKVIAREKKKLAAHGISGSAAVPKIPTQSDPDDRFREDMAKLKKALLSP